MQLVKHVKHRLISIDELRNSFFDHLSADMNVERQLVEDFWMRAKSNVNVDEPNWYPKALKIMRNMLASNEATASAFESTSFKAPEWWDKLSYTQQKEYLKEHKDTELKINKKKPKKAGKPEAPKAEEPKAEKPADDDEEVPEPDDIERISNIRPDDARINLKQASLDKDVDRHNEGHPEPSPQSGVGTDEKSMRIVKNTVAVGRQMVDEQVPTMMQRIKGIGKTAKLGLGAFAKLYSGKELTEEDLIAAKKVGSAVGTAVIGSLVAVAMFTPLAPFAMHLGFQYAMKKNGFGNIFDTCKEEWKSYMEKLHNKDKVGDPDKEKEDVEDAEKDRADSLKKLEEATKGKQDEPDDDTEEQKLAHASVFEAFAGDDQDLARAIAHDFYDTVCTTDIRQMTAALRKMYGPNGERKPE